MLSGLKPQRARARVPGTVLPLPTRLSRRSRRRQNPRPRRAWPATTDGPPPSRVSRARRSRNTRKFAAVRQNHPVPGTPPKLPFQGWPSRHSRARPCASETSEARTRRKQRSGADRAEKGFRASPIFESRKHECQFWDGPLHTPDGTSWDACVLWWVVVQRAGESRGPGRRVVPA